MVKRRPITEVDWEEPSQEECGIVALFNTRETRDNITIALRAAGGVQHRGQQGVGLAIRKNNTYVSHRRDGLLHEVFDMPLQFFPDETPFSLTDKTTIVLVHTRYGTDGGYNRYNLQPCTAFAKNGEPVVVIHNGNFINSTDLRRHIHADFPTDASDTLLFTHYLAESPGNSWEHKILFALSHVKGAYSLAIAVSDALYLARDEFAIRPFVLGRYKDGWIAASESHALDKIGVSVVREIAPGEVTRIDKRGLTNIKPGVSGFGHRCDFEWAYFSRPDSVLPINKKDWLSVHEFRYRCGKIIADEETVHPKLDFVVGIPDSGVPLGTGYAASRGIPYIQAIIRDHFDPNGRKRLFLGDDKKRSIAGKVMGKLSLIPDVSLWKGKRVGVCDDSIVRSNVSHSLTRALISCGVGEVHWLIGYPPVAHTCHLGVSLRTQKELIASRVHGDTHAIAKEIGATSIRFISAKGFISARMNMGRVNIPNDPVKLFLENGGCGGCVTGKYPIDKQGVVYNQQ